MKFKSIEEAQEAFDKQTEELTTAKNELEVAKQVAKEAIAAANEKPADPDKIFVKISGEKFEIVFGVDGLTKEELSKDSKKLAIMVKNGSAALVKVEDK